MNESRDSILDFAITYDLISTNTWFKKRVSHLIIFKRGTSVSQIEFILTQKFDSRCCKDCEVKPRETVNTQHRLESPLIPLQRKSLCNFSMRLATFPSIGSMERK